MPQNLWVSYKQDNFVGLTCSVTTTYQGEKKGQSFTFQILPSEYPEK